MAGTHRALPIERINALVELERLGWKIEPHGDNEISCRCPVHDDKSPSVELNIVKNLWCCKVPACGAKGDIVGLLCHIVKVDRGTMISELSSRYELGEVKSLNPELVEKYHAAIWESGPLLKALRDRGLQDQWIRRARLGYHDGRISIPIYDLSRRITNIRYYLPGAPSKDKMKNTKGYGYPPQLFQPEQLKYDIVWITGGECKAIVGAGLLNEKDIGAVCVAAGEGAWEHSFNSRFKGKKVYVCLDIDNAGKAASRRIAGYIQHDVLSVHIIQLPLNKAVYPKGDINDYVGKENAGVDELVKLMETAERFVDDTTPEDIENKTQPLDTKLSEAAKSTNVGHAITMTAMIQAMDTTPYIVPKTVAVACTRDQPGCGWCPVRTLEPDAMTGKVTMTIRGTSPGLLRLVNSADRFQREGIREALRIPTCKAAVFTIKDNYDVYDVRLTPQLQTSGDNKDHVMQPAYIVGQGNLELNSPYTMTGRVFPHPKNQQAVLLLDTVSSAEDSLTSFKLSQEELESLKIFRIGELSLQEKVDEIYSDIETNVTRIYKRREIHLALDLVFHSVLYLTFDGQRQNGWVNNIIAGDSSQGKSECSQRLITHYGVGTRVDCKNSSNAGLLGGVQPLNNRWFITWGVIPINDRGMVLLEELKGLPVENIATLTDMRSSGVAEISKIERRKAHARTRMAAITNARSRRSVSQFNFGIEIIAEVIGAPEDVRRFDFAIIVSSQQVKSEEINRLLEGRPVVEHKYTSELCRKLVLWAWTRKTEEVKFDRDAEVACLDQAIIMCKRFSDKLPLVDQGTMRYKLARLAAALAARVFSCDETLQVLLVKKQHVEFVAGWLIDLYSSSVYGYEDFSKAQIFAHNVIDPKDVERRINATRHPKDFVSHMLHNAEITPADIQDWCEVDRDGAQKIVSYLVRKHAVYREKMGYIKTAEFIELLKRLRDRNKLSDQADTGIDDESPY